MTHTLTITTDDPAETREVVKVALGEIDPVAAALVVMTALKDMKPPRAKRKDAGKSRTLEEAR